MTTEQFTGTIRFLGVRASFARAKELLSAALEDEISPELREEIETFLAQFEADV